MALLAFRIGVPLFAARSLPAADQRPDPINRAFGHIGRAIGEGAERGDTFRGGRTGMSSGRGGEPVVCSSCDPEGRVDRAVDE